MCFILVSRRTGVAVSAKFILPVQHQQGEREESEDLTTHLNFIKADSGSAISGITAAYLARTSGDEWAAAPGERALCWSYSGAAENALRNIKKIRVSAEELGSETKHYEYTQFLSGVRLLLPAGTDYTKAGARKVPNMCGHILQQCLDKNYVSDTDREWFVDENVPIKDRLICGLSNLNGIPPLLLVKKDNQPEGEGSGVYVLTELLSSALVYVRPLLLSPSLSLNVRVLSSTGL